jgi:hypothetical protein
MRPHGSDPLKADRLKLVGLNLAELEPRQGADEHERQRNRQPEADGLGHEQPERQSACVVSDGFGPDDVCISLRQRARDQARNHIDAIVPGILPGNRLTPVDAIG